MRIFSAPQTQGQVSTNGLNALLQDWRRPADIHGCAGTLQNSNGCQLAFTNSAKQRTKNVFLFFLFINMAITWSLMATLLSLYHGVRCYAGRGVNLYVTLGGTDIEKMGKVLKAQSCDCRRQEAPHD